MLEGGERPAEILSETEQQEYLKTVQRIRDKCLKFFLRENASIVLVVDPSNNSNFMLIFGTDPYKGVHQNLLDKLMIQRMTHPVDSEGNQFSQTDTFIFDGDIIEKRVEIYPLPVSEFHNPFVAPIQIGEARKKELEELSRALEVSERGTIVAN